MGAGVLAVRPVLLATVAMFLGCSAPCCAWFKPNPVTPVDGSYCEAAEQRLAELGGCSLPVRFTAAACRRAAQDGRSYRADCLARLTDCAHLEAAYRAPDGSPCP